MTGWLRRGWMAGPVLALLALGACDANRRPVNSVAGMLAHFQLPPPRPAEFQVCHEHGCKERTRVSLSDGEWAQVRRLMSPPAATAAEERARIARATGLLETLVGPKAGTARDVGGTFSGVGRGPGQLDCEDEAANTTQYLVMMAEDGLLKFHRPIGRQWRGNFLNGWPHTTAVVVETATGAEWAIDTWFEDNGRPAHVVEAQRWRAGWSPDNKTGPQFGGAAR
ncbi:MAG: hypothetical protein AB7R90_08945 [Reyranellaceae bacterium]